MKNKILVLVLVMAIALSGCIPSVFTKGVDFDNYPEKDLPIYDDAIVFEYEDDDDEVTIKYGTEDDVDDVTEFYQDYFEDEDIVLSDENEEDDEYSAEGFYEDFDFEIEVEEAKGENEEKVFSTVVEVTIEFLSDDEIEERQGGDLQNDMLGLWEMVSIEYDGTEDDMSGYGFAMEFMADGTMNMYMFYSNEGLTGNDWSVDKEGNLTYVDPTLLSTTAGMVSIENRDGDTYMYIVEDDGSYTLKKVDKDEFLESADMDWDMWDDDEDEDDDTEVVVPAAGEEVLFNQGGVSITMVGFEEGYSGIDMKLLIDNTTDKGVYLSLEKIVVNGYSMQEAYFYGSVDAEAKLNTELSFDEDEFKMCGIDEIVDIEMIFEVSDAETWDTIVVSDNILVNTGSMYVQTYDKSGTVLVDEQDVKIIYKDFITEDSFFGPFAVLYVENNGTEAIDLDCDDVKVNGFMMSTWLYGSVQPGTCAIMTLEFYESDLEENGITEFNDVQLTFAASYVDEWDDFLETDLITLPIGQ